MFHKIRNAIRSWRLQRLKKRHLVAEFVISDSTGEPYFTFTVSVNDPGQSVASDSVGVVADETTKGSPSNAVEISLDGHIISDTWSPPDITRDATFDDAFEIVKNENGNLIYRRKKEDGE
jgi:hypothetical protein